MEALIGFGLFMFITILVVDTVIIWRLLLKIGSWFDRH